jgi:hypothetical protein
MSDFLPGAIVGFLLATVLVGSMFGGYMYGSGIERGRGQELCSPNTYDHWIDDHNLLCKQNDKTFYVKEIK